MFNEAKPFYIKHLTPPLFLTHQIFIFSSDIDLSSGINLIAKSQSYLKNISSNLIFIYLLRLFSSNLIKVYSGGEAFLLFKAIYKLVKHELCVDRS